MRIVDLRSDTVTMPTEAMRQAMFRAVVGDDVYGEDPTVRELEELGAELTGKEAGLFVASGTMGNQLATLVHTQRGDEIICEAESHVYYYEVGGLAYLAGVQTRTLTGEYGQLLPDQIEHAIRGRDIHQPVTTLLWLENTHNRAGGTCYQPDQLAALKTVAEKHAIHVHMDGARVFNAAAAQNTTVDKLTCHADSVMFCLSKGLCAPVGSLLTGSHDFIARARRYRKMLGGGMRQVGVIAAAGVVALKTMISRLPEDHINAHILSEKLVALGYQVDMKTVQTNIIVFDVRAVGFTAERFAAGMKDSGIKVSQFGEYKVRMVTHYGISRADIDYAAEIAARLLKR